MRHRRPWHGCRALLFFDQVFMFVNSLPDQFVHKHFLDFSRKMGTMENGFRHDFSIDI
jgi:hypothetical protein